MSDLSKCRNYSINIFICFAKKKYWQKWEIARKKSSQVAKYLHMLACTWLQETDKIPFHLERRTQLQQTYPDAVNACSTDIKCDILCWSLFFPAPGEACRGVGDPPGVSGCGAGSQEPGHVVLSDFAVGEHRTSHQQLSGHHRQAADRGSKHKNAGGEICNQGIIWIPVKISTLAFLKDASVQCEID